MSAGGGQLVELFYGNSSTVTLPQSFDTYKVLFVVARSDGDAESGVCVPPSKTARFYDGERNQMVGFSGNTASAPYLYTITNIYAIA